MFLVYFLFIDKVFCQNYLTAIPNEFETLRNKALESAKKRIKEINNDEAITPNKPYISDSFVGYVNNILFGLTVKDLEGVAISDEYKYIAIIVNRKTMNGQEILKEKSMFIDKQTNSVYSLFQKIADDGKVAIFNISKVDEFQIFDRFQLTLPKSTYFDGKCTDTGSDFGGRCWTDANINWNDEKDIPQKTSIKHKNIKFDAYYGAKGRTETSVIVKKNSECSIQIDIDSSFNFRGGIGFHIDKFNYTLSDFDIMNEVKVPIVTKNYNILGLQLNINVLFVFQPKIELFQAYITKPISLIKVFKLRLRKTVTLSSKHKNTNDNEKDFHIETLYEDGSYDNYDDSLIKEAFFRGNISIKAGVRVITNIATASFNIEAGIKPLFNFSFLRNTTKCTSPSFFGTFSPSIDSYVHFSGEIKLGFIKLFSKSKDIIKKIISFDGNYGSCLYNDDNSNEATESLIDQTNKSLNLIKFSNFYVTADGRYSILNNVSNSKRFFTKDLFFDKKNNQFSPKEAYIVTKSYQKFTNIKSILIHYFNNSLLGRVISKNLSDNCHYDIQVKLKKNPFYFSIDSLKTRSVSFGKQFDMDNSEFINSRLSNTPDFLFNLGFIYKVNNEYRAHYNNYKIIGEYDDAPNNGIDGVYKSTDYSSLNIKIELNNEYSTGCNFKNNESQTLYVYHKQELKKDHLLYVGYYYCINNEIEQQFESNEIYVPLTESKGNKECIKIYFEDDIINLTRNDMMNSNNTIIKKFQKYIYKITVSYPKYPEYIFQMNENGNISQSNSTKGIIARIFQFKNNKIISFDGIPQTIHFKMAKNEVYGIYRGLFNYHGENLSHTYALINMPNMQPLTNDAKLIEYDTYYIKLDNNSNLIKRYLNDPNDNSYDIIIPFRRRSINRNNNLNITLLMIFQAEESSKGGPYCSLFSKFSINSNTDIIVGCIHNYSTNAWEYYSSINTDQIQEQEINLPNSQYKLHCISMKNELHENITNISIYATLKYINFPLTTRYMILEEEIANLFYKYCYGDYLKVICERCDRIVIEKNENEIEMIHIQDQDDIFMIVIDENFQNLLPMVAYCNSNESEFCTFEMNIKNDGYTLVEYNDQYKPYSIYLDDDLPDSLPGIDEIFKNSSLYDINDTRLDSGFKRQILYRKDKIIATKPWKGPIKKIIKNIESKKLQLKITYKTVFKDYIELSIHDQDNTDIPFSPKKFYESINSLNSYPFSQLGIKINFVENDTDNAIYMNSDAHIVFKKSAFNEKKLKKISSISKLELIDLPENCYKVYYDGSADNIKKSKLIIILGSVIPIILSLCICILVWRCLCCKKKDSINEEQSNQIEKSLLQNNPEI